MYMLKLSLAFPVHLKKLTSLLRGALITPFTEKCKVAAIFRVAVIGLSGKNRRATFCSSFSQTSVVQSEMLHT